MRFVIVVGFIIFMASFLTFATESELGTVDISNSTIITMNINSSGFGGIMGMIKIKVGSFEWYPTDVWLVPENYTTDNLSYINKYYKVGSGLNVTNDCRSSRYKTADGRVGFKSSISTNGNFCILGDPGRYKIVVEYS